MQLINFITVGLTMAYLSVLGFVKAATLGNDTVTSALGAQVAHLDTRVLAQTVKTVVYTVAYGPDPNSALYRTDKREINGATDPKYEAVATESNEFLKRQVETVTKTVTVIPDFCSPLLPVGFTTGLANSSIRSIVINTMTIPAVPGFSNSAATPPVPAVTGATTSTLATNTRNMTGITPGMTSAKTGTLSISSTLGTTSSSNIKSISTTPTTAPEATPTLASRASGLYFGTLALSAMMFLAFCAVFAFLL